MMEQILFSEQVEVLTRLAPASYSSAQTLTRVKADKHTRIVVLLGVGAMTATGTLDMTVQQATLVTGGSLKNIKNKAGNDLTFTQLLAASGGGKDYIAFEFRTGALDPAYPWIAVVATPATAASIFGVWVLGVDPKYAPVSQANWSQANY